jgi:DNA-binding response OmpR family regulator
MLGVIASPVPSRIRHDRGRIGEECPQRILLVEDDEHVRCLLVLALQLAGYEVHDAACADDALRLAETLPSLDAVVADVGLPRIPGPRLVELLREERPGLEALHITGHVAETAERLGLDPYAPVLHKPFAPGELVAAVAALVA